jgi:predicted ArsR family transcriptional regulator
MALKSLTKYRKVSYIVLAKTLKLLMAGPITAHELSEDVGIHLITAQEWMRSLHKEKAVYISGWLPDRLGRDVTAVYAAGSKPDKPRGKLTPAERSHRYREKQKQLKQQAMITGAVL